MLTAVTLWFTGRGVYEAANLHPRFVGLRLPDKIFDVGARPYRSASIFWAIFCEPLLRWATVPRTMEQPLPETGCTQLSANSNSGLSVFFRVTNDCFA
jgi:hypothetical protein